MAGVGPQPQSGRKRSLDAEVNLVPPPPSRTVVDVICGMLMTAVWMESAAVTKAVVGGGGASRGGGERRPKRRKSPKNSTSIRLAHPIESIEKIGGQKPEFKVMVQPKMSDREIKEC